VTTTETDPTTLVLARPVQAGERVTVSMSWTLRLPRTPTERLASRFISVVNVDGSGSAG
jgi:hypothetical protein